MNAQIAIGTGTAVDQALPIEPYYGYTYSEVIYLASDINASGDITTLDWYFEGATLSSSNNWTIYMGHTTKSAFASTTDWITSTGMTQVYSGTFTDPAGPGWLQFDITDFTYNGTDNLVIAVLESASSLTMDQVMIFTVQQQLELRGLFIGKTLILSILLPLQLPLIFGIILRI